MARSKLKNIVLLLLALTNLALLYFVVQKEFQDERMRRQARESAVSFLEERGVQVKAQVPGAMSLAAQTVERDREREAALAAALLKGEAVEESRGGEVYRYYNENGFVQFHNDGAFSAEFSPGVFPLGGDRERACLEALALLDFQGELVGEETDSLTFRQVWEGSPLFTQQVTLVCGEDCLTAMTAGRRLMGAPAADSRREPVTVPTALFSFYNGLKALGDVCSRIDVIAQGYVGTASLSGSMELTPVWRITTDTGAYQLDTITGTLSRVA